MQTDVTLSAADLGDGYQAMITYPDGVSISSAERFATIAEALAAAARKLCDQTRRLEALCSQ